MPTNDNRTIKVEFDPNQSVGVRRAGADEDGPVYEEMTLIDAVIERAAAQLLERITTGAFNDMRKKTAEALEAMLRRDMSPRIAALLDGEITVTESWGGIRHKGTLRDLIIKYAQEQLTAVTDRYGHPQTTLAKIMQTEVDRVLSQELTAAVREARRELVGTVQKNAAQIMAKAVVDGVMRDR